jgi:hypothetical protein
MLMLLGWHPQAPRHRAVADPAAPAGVLTASDSTIRRFNEQHNRANRKLIINH